MKRIADPGEYCGQRGFSLIEFLFVITFGSIMTGVVVFNFLALRNNIRHTASTVEGFLKKSRSLALVSTKSYAVAAESVSKARIYSGTSCVQEDMVAEDKFFLDLPNDTVFTSVSWFVCYSPRGISEESTTINIQNDEGEIVSLETAVGGAVRIK